MARELSIHADWKDRGAGIGKATRRGACRSVPVGSYSPSSSELGRGRSTRNRKPATTQSAVRSFFTLTIALFPG
jgi:hypothetical protein